MTCKEFLAQLNEYYDATMAKEVVDEMRKHMGTCDHCDVVYNTTRQTIEIYRNNEVYEFSPSLRERLCAAIMAKCKGKKPGCGSVETTTNANNS